MSASTSEISINDIENFCQKYFSINIEEKLSVLNYHITSIDGTPTGFLGLHRILNVLVEKKTSTNRVNIKLRFFLKSSPNDVPAQMEYIEEFGAFKKEVAVFQHVIPHLENYIINNKYFAPKCYLAKENYLIFENLIDQGYYLGAKRDGILNYNHLICALNSLAHLHSTSIIFESKSGMKINEIYKDIIIENSYPNDTNATRTKYFFKSSNALCELIKIIPKYQNSNKLKNILIEFPKKLKLIFELCKKSEKFLNTFSHGDLWANNIMFRYELNEPIECRLVDFQLARYSPPALDLLTILTIPTTSKFRSEHLNNLLTYYWDMLNINLNKSSMNLTDFITKNEFNESIEYFKIAGLIESCLFSHLTLLPEELTSSLLKNSNNFNDFINHKRGELCVKAFKSDIIYRERLTDMISDIIDNYILKK